MYELQMMQDELTVIGLALFLTLIFRWGFRTLPGENWQILATIPHKKKENGQWTGENLTYYGMFNAHAYTFAVIIFIFLLGSLKIPVSAILPAVAGMLGICVPASRILAGLVEKKRYTFTVGGASFAGILAAPLVVWSVSSLFGKQAANLQSLPFLAALCTAYAFGEGIGRLACISFGCCYGKALKDCSPPVQKIFRNFSFVFTGSTKKIAYAHGLEGEKVLPVQAVTSVIYSLSGICGVYFFLKGFYTAAFLLTLLTTQIWRCVSECFRADYRGEGRISAYQIMGILTVLCGILLCIYFPVSESEKPDLLYGMEYLWSPAMLLFLQTLWISIFLYTGRSKVTGAFLSYHVIQENV